MQNVHAMRAEVRADYEAALGDRATATRRSRCASSASSPSCATRWSRSTATDPRFAGGVGAAAGRDRATRRPSARAELRMLDHEREITPDWLQREQAVGYVTYVDRFAGTLAGVRAKLPYLRELGVTYLHLMPLLHARPAPNDGGYAVRRLRRGRARRWGRWTTCARWPTTCARRAWRCAWTSCSTTPRPSTVDGAIPTSTATFPDRVGARRVRAHAARGLPGHRARAASRGRGARPLGLDDVQRLPVGPRLHEPGRLRGDGLGDAGAGRGGRRRAAAGRRAVPVEAAGHATARTSPRSTSCCRPSGRRCGSPRPRSRSRPRRSSRPRDLVPYLGHRAATRARSATSPTTTC